jgi:hypothetical protein
MTASLCLSGRGEYRRVLQMERARTVAMTHVQAPMVTVNVPEDRRQLRQGCQVFEALRAPLPLPEEVKEIFQGLIKHVLVA